MAAKAVLNIGLNVGGVEVLNVNRIFRTFKRFGIPNVKGWGLVHSNTENTMVVYLKYPLAPSVAEELSVSLEQDCIAQYLPKERAGYLHGPKAKEWGPFNIDYFIFLKK